MGTNNARTVIGTGYHRAIAWLYCHKTEPALVALYESSCCWSTQVYTTRIVGKIGLQALVRGHLLLIQIAMPKSVEDVVEAIATQIGSNFNLETDAPLVVI